MYYGWRIVAVAMLGLGLSNGLTSYSFGLLVLPIGTEFGASRMEMMWAMTAGALTSILISPAAGTLMDKRSARVLFTIGALFLSAALVLISLARNVWEFILVFGVVMSVSNTLLGPLGANTLVARWFSRQRGRALGVTAIGTSLGGLLVPLMLQTLIDAYGWRTACLSMAGVVLLLLLPPILLLVRSRPADLGLLPDGAVAAVDAQGAAAAATNAEMPDLLRDAAFWRISLAVGVLMAAFTAVLANLVPFAVGHGVAPKQAALLISVISVAGVSGKLLFSVFADRINLKTAILGALVMVGAPLLVLTQSPVFWVMVLAALSVGMASGAFLPAWGAILARIYGPLVFGRVMGRMQPVTIVMVMLAMPMTGFLFDVTGSYSAAFLVLAAAVAVAVAGFLPLQVRSRD
ncbi:MAG: MFS transporter [Betaproteobacteria bacterium]|nr:MFS transporter [Rhodocyclales bacterium]